VQLGRYNGIRLPKTNDYVLINNNDCSSKLKIKNMAYCINSAEYAATKGLTFDPIYNQSSTNMWGINDLYNLNGVYSGHNPILINNIWSNGILTNVFKHKLLSREFIDGLFFTSRLMSYNSNNYHVFQLFMPKLNYTVYPFDYDGGNSDDYHFNIAEQFINDLNNNNQLGLNDIIEKKAAILGWSQVPSSSILKPYLFKTLNDQDIIVGDTHHNLIFSINEDTSPFQLYLDSALTDINLKKALFYSGLLTYRDDGSAIFTYYNDTMNDNKFIYYNGSDSTYYKKFGILRGDSFIEDENRLFVMTRGGNANTDTNIKEGHRIPSPWCNTFFDVNTKFDGSVNESYSGDATNNHPPFRFASRLVYIDAHKKF